MKRAKITQLLAVLFTMMLTLTACGAKESNTGKESADTESYTVWIGKGEDVSYLPEYEDNPVLQYYLRTPVKNSEGKDVQLAFDFQVPAVGNEKDNFNTLIATGDYMDIMNTSYMTGSLEDMYKEGIILDLTDYVNQYMPNYKAFLDNHPELALATTNLVDGEKRYLALYTLNSSVNEFQGFLYRRDWIVKYGKNPTTGEAFSGEYTQKQEDGTWNTDTWTDNVIFPSGGADPVNISDWEWMFGIFQTALEDNNITDGYCLSIPLAGSSQQGYLESSFGGSASSWYVDENNTVQYGASNEEFRTYLQCVSEWYKNGWVDQAFLGHTSDMPWRIDEAKVRQGKVGLWRGTESQLYNRMNLGDELTKDIIVYAASLPINDVYGTEENKFKDPYSVFQLSVVGNPFVITDKAKDRDLATLFTFLNTLYDPKNTIRNGFGLSKEENDQLPSKYYEQWGLVDGAYSDSGKTNDKGQKILLANPVISGDDILTSARTMFRFLCLNGNSDDYIVLDPKLTEGYMHQKEQWSKYNNTGLLPYQFPALLPSADAKLYSTTNTNLTEFQAKNTPEFIIGEKDPYNDEDWNNYVKALNKYNPQAVLDSLTNLLHTLQQ